VKCLKKLNETILISASDDETIKIWNYQNGQLVRTLNHHTDWVRGLAILSNKQFASGSYDRTIKIWDTSSWTILRSISLSEMVRSLALLADGNLVFNFFASSTIKILNPNTGTIIRTLVNRNSSVHFYSLEALSGNKVASGASNGDISIFNGSNGELVRSLRGHRDAVWALLELGDGKLVSGSDDGELRFWDVQNGEILGSFKAHDYWVVGLGVSTSEPSLLVTIASCFTSPCNSSVKTGEIKIWK
jgi:WD40 repeat protein